MLTKNLDEIFNELVDLMRESIEFTPDKESYDFDFIFEDYGFSIEGHGEVGGTWYEEGDGYMTPRESYLRYGWGRLDELTITHCDEETGEETEITEEMIDKISERLQDDLSMYMKEYE